MGIFEELRVEHAIQRNLVSQLLDTSGDSSLRQKLFGQLKTSLESHAAAEERHFYTSLLEHDLTQEKGRHSVAEHKELDDYIEQLDDINMSSQGWIALFKTLAERLEHHLAEEEHEVFQMAGKVLSEKEKTDLGKSYRQHMETLEKDAA